MLRRVRRWVAERPGATLLVGGAAALAAYLFVEAESRRKVG